MLRRLGWVLRAGAALCLLTTLSPGNDEDRPPDKATQEFVTRWAEKAAALKTVDVRFQRDDSSLAWGDERFEGRLRLHEQFAHLEMKTIAENGTASPLERLVWTESELHLFKEQVRQEYVFVYPQKRRKAPELAALPFLYGMTTDDVLKKYEVKLIRETPESFVVGLRPRERGMAQSFSRAYLVLDGRTYLPRRFSLVSPNGKDTKVFRALETRVNDAIDPEAFQPRVIEGWEVFRSDGTNGHRLHRGAILFGIFDK